MNQFIDVIVKAAEQYSVPFAQNLDMLHEKREKLNIRLTGCGHEIQRLQIELNGVESLYNTIWDELEAVEELIYEIEQGAKVDRQTGNNKDTQTGS